MCIYILYIIYISYYIYYIYQDGFLYWGIGGNPPTRQKIANSPRTWTISPPPLHKG